MSKQQFVAGVEPLQVWAWIEAPDAGASLATATGSAAATRPAPALDRRATRRVETEAAGPMEDPIEPWRRLQERLEPLLGAPDRQDDFPGAVRSLALDILQKVEQDPDFAILALLRLDAFDYAVAHALQTAIACDVYGQAVGTPLEQRLVMIQAALTMNIAMLELQRELEWQATPPTPEQRRQIHLHPQKGREQLEALGVRNQAWLDIVARHHETPEGSGYPSGCRETSAEAHLLALADRYCAMLSRRGARDCMVGNRAARSLFNEAHVTRQPLVAGFIGVFGQHPPGSLVRLVNGEIGIVIRRGNESRAEWVCALASSSGERLAEPMLRDTTAPVHVIVGSVPDRDFKGVIDFVALWHLMG